MTLEELVVREITALDSGAINNRTQRKEQANLIIEALIYAVQESFIPCLICHKDNCVGKNYCFRKDCPL